MSKAVPVRPQLQVGPAGGVRDLGQYGRRVQDLDPVRCLDDLDGLPAVWRAGDVGDHPVRHGRDDRGGEQRVLQRELLQDCI